VLHESRSLDRRISALLISPIAVFIRAIGATLGALIAAFCRLDKSLSWEKGWLVGAVGIEPLPRGMKRNAVESRSSEAHLGRGCSLEDSWSFGSRAIQAFWDPVVTRAAENCSQKPDAYPLMPPFAASFFCNYRHMKKLWRKRVGVEFAMIVQIASVYAALHTTRSFQSVRFSTFWSQTFYNSPLDGIPPCRKSV